MKISDAIELAKNKLESRVYGEEAVSTCPFCESKDKKFYININTGQYSCKKGACGVSGNMSVLLPKLGIEFDSIEYDDVKAPIKPSKAVHEIKVDGLSLIKEDHSLVDYMMSRGISHSTLANSGVLHSAKHNALTFITKFEGRIVGCLYRKPGKKLFMEAGSEQRLWGVQTFKKSKDNTLYITEGHPDCLTLREMGYYNSVSVPNGANSHEWINRDWEWIRQFEKIVLCYDNDDVGKNAILEVKNRLDFAQLYELEYGECNDINEMFMVDCEALFKTVRTPKEINMDGFISLRGVSTNSDPLALMGSCGISQFDRMFGGMRLNETTLIAAASGAGKAVPNTTNVFTECGQMKISELSAGDMVFGEDGELHKVVGVYPQGKKEILKVTFSDGTVSECCEDHLWTTYSRHGKEYTTKTKDIKIGSSIPKTLPVKFKAREHVLSPYLLGVLIGDGCLSNGRARFSTSEEYIVNKVRNEVSSIGDFTITKNKHNYTYTIGRSGTGKNIATEEIKRLGLNVTSRFKFIPKEYLFDSVENRIGILNGIFDTDGCVRGQRASISTMSSQLKDDIVWICQSLGMLATVSYDRREKYKECGVCYMISINFSNTGIAPFTSPKHKGRFVIKNRKNDAKRVIRSVVSTGVFVDMTCIQVSNKSKLFLIDGFVATHNTTVISNLINGFMGEGESTAVWSGELTNATLKTWIYSVVAGDKAITTVDNPYRPGEVISMIKPDYELKIDQAVDGKLHVYDGNKSNGFKMLEHFELLHKRYGVKNFIIDNGSILDMTMPGSKAGKYDGEEAWSKEAAKFVRNNAVRLFIVMHPTKTTINSDPNYMNNKGKVKKPEMYDQYQIRGSAAIPNLAHNIMFLIRAGEHYKAWMCQRTEEALTRAKRPQEIPRAVELIQKDLSLIAYLTKNRGAGHIFEETMFGYDHSTRRIFGLQTKHEDLAKEFILEEEEVQQIPDDFAEDFNYDDF